MVAWTRVSGRPGHPFLGMAPWIWSVDLEIEFGIPTAGSVSGDERVSADVLPAGAVRVLDPCRGAV